MIAFVAIGERNLLAFLDWFESLNQEALFLIVISPVGLLTKLVSVVKHVGEWDHNCLANLMLFTFVFNFHLNIKWATLHQAYTLVNFFQFYFFETFYSILNLLVEARDVIFCFLHIPMNLAAL